MHMHKFPSNALSLIQELKHERVAMTTILFFVQFVDEKYLYIYYSEYTVMVHWCYG